MTTFIRLAFASLLLTSLLACGTKRPRPTGVPEVIQHDDRKAAWETSLRVIKERGLSVYEWDEERGVIVTGWETSFSDGASERRYRFTFLVTDERVDVDSRVEFCTPVNARKCKLLTNFNKEERNHERAIIRTLRQELAWASDGDVTQ